MKKTLSHRIQRKIVVALLKLTERFKRNYIKVAHDLNQLLFFMDFEERDSDIYIATYLKSGTTWMQVILYNMLHEVDMNFNHIYDVSPWVKNEALRLRTPKRINELPSPRILKTHDRYDFFDKSVKGKYICVLRDGKDVAASLFYHNRNYRDPDLTFTKNFDKNFVDDSFKMNWFSHVRDWIINKENLDVHYVTYHEMKSDFEGTLKNIAQFLGIELTDERIQQIKENTSFENMKKHEDKFGAIPSKQSRLVFDQFIRKGESGEGKEQMSEEQLKLFNAKYNIMIKPLLPKIKKKNL